MTERDNNLVDHLKAQNVFSFILLTVKMNNETTDVINLWHFILLNQDEDNCKICGKIPVPQCILFG